MHLIRSRRHHRHFSNINRLGVVNLFSSFGSALVGTIWALYLDSFFHDTSTVGWVSSILTLVGIISYLFIIPLIERSSKSKLYSFTLVVYTLSYILFSLLSDVYALAIIAVFLYFVGSIRLTTFGIMVRDMTENASSVSKNEGLMYTFLNLAWLLGPLLAGFVAEQYGLNYVFLPAALFLLIALQLMRSFKIRDDRRAKRLDKNSLKVFREFFRKRDRVMNYLLSAAVTFWWALIYIYIPLHIVRSGLEEIFVGYFLFAAVLPLLLFEYHFGNVASKVGFKKIFKVAFISLAVICFIAFGFENIYIIMALMVFASVFLAMIEPTTESYFFDMISESQRDKFYGPYATAIDVGHYIGTASSALILSFLPFNYVFLLYGFVMLVFFFISFKIKNVIESRRKH